jgi:hypothetical protein
MQPTTAYCPVHPCIHSSFNEMVGEVHHVPVWDDPCETVVLIGDRKSPEIISGKTCCSPLKYEPFRMENFPEK